MTRAKQEHEMLPEGESTAKWACNGPDFWGTINQLTCCARCGEVIRKRRDEPMHLRDIFKPSVHVICDECWDELPVIDDEAGR